jgi:hypothetical protein
MRFDIGSIPKSVVDALSSQALGLRIEKQPSTWYSRLSNQATDYFSDFDPSSW